MIIYQGKKVTPTQFAKLVLGDWVSKGEEYFWEDLHLEEDRLTDTERDKLKEAVEKQADRIYKLLGWWELREKVLDIRS